MPCHLGQSVWFGSEASIFPEVVALLCKEHAPTTLTFADGSDRDGMLLELDEGDLWFRPLSASGYVSLDRCEGVPIEHVLAIRVLQS